jgi:hypothetical protein
LLSLRALGAIAGSSSTRDRLRPYAAGYGPGGATGGRFLAVLAELIRVPPGSEATPGAGTRKNESPLRGERRRGPLVASPNWWETVLGS